MGCGGSFSITRRDLLKLALLSAFAPLSSPLTKKANAVEAKSINPAEFVKLIDFKCLSCDVDILGCMKISWKGVKVAPRITYWMPVAFVESGLAFEFGKAFPAGEVISPLLSPLKEILAPFVPKGTYSIYQGTAHQNHMKVYPHWYGFPPPLKKAIKTAVIGLNSLNPICLGCNLADTFINSVFPMKKIVDKINDKLDEIGIEKIKKFKEIGDKIKEKINKIQDILDNASKTMPVLPSEVFFFIWTLEQFNVDNKTIAPALVGAIQALQGANPAVGALSCPHLTRYIGRHFNLPFGVDFDFICVGYWGFGYPRMGIVRHDDPIVANLLAIARFHHLFSKTIKLIEPKFSYSNIKYQMFSPVKMSCFTPGYRASDPIVDMLYQAGDIENIKQYVSNPEKLKKEFASQMKDRGLSALTALVKQRSVGLVVWQRFSKCCW